MCQNRREGLNEFGSDNAMICTTGPSWLLSSLDHKVSLSAMVDSYIYIYIYVYVYIHICSYIYMYIHSLQQVAAY